MQPVKRDRTGIKDAALQALVDGVQVKRLHTIPTVGRGETVGHHIGLICGLIAITYPRASSEMYYHAAIHDLGEYHTGDMPSPVKKERPELKHELDIAEIDYLDRIDVPTYSGMTSDDVRMFKVYDNVAGMIMAYSEALLGNRNMIWVFRNFLAYYRSSLENKAVPGGCKSKNRIIAYNRIFEFVAGLERWFNTFEGE